MAKSNGLGDQLFVDGFDLSGDVGTLTRIAAPSTVLEVPGINATGMERIYARHDGEIAFTSYFNDATGQEHLTLRGKSAGVDLHAMYFRGSAIGNVAAALVAKQINYDPNRGADGSLVSTTQCLGNLYGLDWGYQLTAGKRTDTSATNGSSLNNTASSATGGVAYIQVFSVAGTSVTIAIQSSSDNGGGDAFAAILTSSAVTAGSTSFQRLALAALTTSCEQYLRVSTSGTFSSAVFAVMFSREPRQL